MKSIKRFLFPLLILAVSACGNTKFQSTWHAPTAASENLQQKATAAFLISGNEAVRRSFEMNVAEQLTKHGIETQPGYEVLPNTDVTKKEDVLSKLRNTKIDTAVFMRIVDRHQEVSFVPTAWYTDPYYDRFWWRHGRFFGPSFGGPWPPFYDSGYFQTDTIVSVSTMIYSVPDSNLVWAGTSRTMNPSKVEGFVKELVSETVKKLKDTGMVTATS